MAIIIFNNLQFFIPGLGTRKPIANLVHKTITTTARKILRQHHPLQQLTVSCAATKVSGGWQGTYRVNGAQCTYRIQ
jgi:hypothetical protein